MGKVKQQYQDELAQSDEQLWEMLECAYYEYQLQHEAYAYEDTHNINELPNTVSYVTKEQA